MVDVIKTQKHLDDFFQSTITQILGYNPQETQDRVRISWPTKGSPAWRIDENVAFIQVTPTPNPTIQQQDTNLVVVDSQSLTSQKTYLREISVDIVCYGSGAWNDAETIWNGFLSETILQTLEKNYLGFIDREGPVRVPELFNGQWWDRADLTLRFYEGVKKETTIKAFGSVVIGINGLTGNNDGSETDPVIVKEG